jgi:hypothetical protein
MVSIEAGYHFRSGAFFLYVFWVVPGNQMMGLAEKLFQALNIPVCNRFLWRKGR